MAFYHEYSKRYCFDFLRNHIKKYIGECETRLSDMKQLEIEDFL